MLDLTRNKIEVLPSLGSTQRLSPHPSFRSILLASLSSRLQGPFDCLCNLIPEPISSTALLYLLQKQVTRWRNRCWIIAPLGGFISCMFCATHYKLRSSLSHPFLISVSVGLVSGYVGPLLRVWPGCRLMEELQFHPRLNWGKIHFHTPSGSWQIYLQVRNCKIEVPGFWEGAGGGPSARDHSGRLEATTFQVTPWKQCSFFKARNSVFAPPVCSDGVLNYVI